MDKCWGTGVSRFAYRLGGMGISVCEGEHPSTAACAEPRLSALCRQILKEVLNASFA